MVSFQFKDDDKARYAAALLRRPNQPLEAAIEVFGSAKSEVGKCSYVATTWPSDAEVIEHQQKLLADGGVKKFLPTKEEVARQIWEWTQLANLGLEEKLKAAKLYCEINDFIAKPGASVTVNTNTTLRVMEVPVAVSDEQWEADLKKQQEQSMQDARAVH